MRTMTDSQITDLHAARTVEVSRDRSDDVGGCSFCDRYITEHGETCHRVYNVGGNGVSVRFCEPCARTFAAKVRP